MDDEFVNYESFFKDFDFNYRPKYGFCPLNVITYIKRYYGVDYNEAQKIYIELNKFKGAIVRINDFLYEELVVKSKK